jgi:hypothetical protein
MARPGGPSGDDRTPDPFADGPGDEHSLAVSIPDDARELEADVAAYRKEIGAHRRRERFDRYTLARYWRPYGIPFPVLIAALVVVGAVGGLLLALLPNPGSTTQHSEPLPPATGQVGKVNGVLPDVNVDVDKTTESVQKLRPSVLALVPPTCGCAAVIDNSAQQTAEFGLSFYVVSSQQDDPQMASLIGDDGTSRTPVYDAGGRLLRLYSGGTTGVTLVLVHANAVVASIVTGATPTTSVRAVLTKIDSSAA